MRRLVVPVLAFALLATVTLAGTANAVVLPETGTYLAPTDCYTCHTGTGPAVSKVDFSVALGPVDRNACKACHAGTTPYGGLYEPPTGEFPNGAPHVHYGDTCAGCHDGEYGPLFTPAMGAPTFCPSLISTAYGIFGTVSSPQAPASVVHAAHRGAAWVTAPFGVSRPDCQPCHASAACSACHVDAVAHGTHGASTTCTAAGCHNIAAATTKPSCTTCHAVQTSPHGYGTIDHVATDGTIDGVTCSACHALDLATAHLDPGAAGTSCATCHPTPRDAIAGGWDQTCATAGCHTVGSTRPMHAGIASAHAVSPANAMCLDCHAGTELGSVHALASDIADGTTSCGVCHKGTAKPATGDCTVCHFTFVDHYGAERHTSSWTLVGCSGTGCHSTRDLLGVHTEKNPAFTCDGCHKNFSVALQIQNHQTGCGDCHAGVTQSTGHREAHWATPLLQDATGPRYSYSTGSVGTQPTGDCIGCHVSNFIDEHMGLNDTATGYPIRLPRYAADGSALTCDTCHGSAEPTVVAAIASGAAACEACHPVHAPIPQVHVSSFVENPALACADCHSANIAEEHDGGYTATTPSGVRLVGCDVCHAYYEGARGVQVQAAIAVANDTRCSACHAAYHTQTAVHDATSAASLECGGCHDPGSAAIDVTAVHVGSALGACKVCHASAAVGEISTHTAECASCHAAEGADYHTNMGVHIAPDSVGCQVTGCHHSGADVTEVHSAGCATCHNAVLDLTGKTTACINCHATEGVDYHYAFDAKHVPADAASADCARCHDTTDVRELHVTSGCNACHFNNGCTDCHGVMGMLHKTAACATCHPTEGTNYHTGMATSHTFTAMDSLCVSCHGANTLPEVHEPYLSRYSQYADTCALCHENADPARIPVGATADCSSCHVVHGDLGTLHTTSSSSGCVACHGSGDVRELHGAAPDDSCVVCHNAGLDLTGKTTECSSCHTTEKTDYHRQMDSLHIGLGTSGTCEGAGCHPSRDVTVIHERYVGAGAQYSEYPDTCALCHRNADPARIDWTVAADGTCANCHGVPHDRMNHTASSSASAECAGCHGPWVPAVHGADPAQGGSFANCDTCHNNATKGDLAWTKSTSDCEGCHSYSPAATNHYPVAAHTATETGGCANCHSLELAAEHAKATSGPVDCLACHTSSLFAAMAKPWSGTCDACHATKHADAATKHAAARTDCAGSGCHAVTDVSTIHAALGTDGGCSTCHSASAAPSTDCGTSGCHAGVTGNHHEMHNSAAVNPTGCSGCHFMYLDDEHAALGYTCDTCHKSTSPTAQGAIAASDLRCMTCHPGSPHNQRQSWEFNPARASLHRVSADLPGMRSSFAVSGSTYTWSLPSASSFLKAGWTTSSMMTCTDCHSYSGASGPHGATMKVNIDPAYSKQFRVTAGTSSNAQLSPNSPTGMSMTKGGNSPAGIICEKCHDLNGTSGSFGNVVHKEHDSRGSEGGYCNYCHTGLPHGWSRPRLIGYTTDAAPYKTATGGVQRISLKSYTPSSWQKSDCGAGCSSGRHPLSGSSWPASDVVTPPAPTTGAVSGTVSGSDTGAGVASAAVSIAGKSVSTAANGTYTVIDIAAGSYTMTVSASGYETWTGTVAITAGGATTQNVTLAATPVAPPTVANIAVGSTATASSQDSYSASASKSIDGNAETYWRSNGHDTEWLRLDLGSARTYDRVIVKWYGSRYARSYRIQTSSDGSNWTTRYSDSSGNGGSDEITFTAVTDRYIRVYCTSANDYDYRISEFEVWGR